MSLRARLAVLTGAAVACAVVVGAFLSYNLVRDQLYQQVDDSLRSRIKELTSFSVAFGDVAISGGKQIQIVAQHQAGQTSGVLSCPAAGNVASPSPAPTPVPLPPGCTPNPSQSGNMPAFAGAVMAVGVPSTSLGAAGSYTQFITAQGDKALSPGEVNALPVNGTDRAVAAGRASATLRTDTIDGVPVRLATAQMPGGVASHGVAVMVARPLDETEAVLANLRELLVLIGAAGVALAAGLGVFVARTTMRPVRRLIAATDHVAGTRDLSRRIHVRGGSELDHLAMSFNDMLAALERSETTQRQLVADASHELRTPLTSLRTNVEILALDRRMPATEKKRVLASVLGQLERLSDLVTGLLDLARGNEPASQETNVVLGDVVELAVGTARSHWPSRTFTVSRDDSVVHGDATRLEGAVGNLLDNAAKWSPDNGAVDVVVDDGAVRVRDRGPGVAPADRSHVFDRFWRAPGARHLPGSGLGLAIVRQVAQTHRGDVAVTDAEGGGAVFTLSLPPVHSSKTLTPS